MPYILSYVIVLKSKDFSSDPGDTVKDVLCNGILFPFGSMNLFNGPSIWIVTLMNGCCFPSWCCGTSHPGSGGSGGTLLFSSTFHLNIAGKFVAPVSPVMNVNPTGSWIVFDSVLSSIGGCGGLPPEPLHPPGGVRPCQPGWVTPVPGSVETDLPSALTVAVPSITSIPVVWSKLRKSSFVPGAALNVFGNVIGAGVAKRSTPGACTVMSKVCCNTPGGSMSRTSDGSTVLIPI